MKNLTKLERVILVLMVLSTLLAAGFTCYNRGQASRDCEVSKNEQIVNYLYEKDMRGEIQLDHDSIFVLHEIK
jgi:hypothetical protein